MERRGTSATRAKNKYNKKTYDSFLVFLPTGKKAEIDKAVKELGYKSRNEFIVTAINEKIQGGRSALNHPGEDDVLT